MNRVVKMLNVTDWWLTGQYRMHLIMWCYGVVVCPKTTLLMRSEVSTFSSQKSTHFQSLLLIDNKPFAGKSVQGQATLKYKQSL